MERRKTKREIVEQLVSDSVKSARSIGGKSSSWTCRIGSVMPWLHVKENYFELILKSFHCYISHVTTSETEIKLFQRPNEF